jgi:transketolase
MISTRKAYGMAITKYGATNEQIMVLDAETSNSTFADIFAKAYPTRFIECFIAEQNMVSVATGLSRMGKIPFCSTFGAFLTRSFDQIRMAQYSLANLKLVGSHAGCSIGVDGSSQMALEDIAMMRSVRESVILYPSDAISCDKLVLEMIKHTGISYLRTTREDTPILYLETDEFAIGKSRVLRQSDHDQITLVGAGITLHECLKAYEILQKQKVNVRVIDLYSIKPLDINTLAIATNDTGAMIVVEDHYANGGIYSSVCEELINHTQCPIYQLAVTKMPLSGKPAELLEFMEIDAKAIVKLVTELLEA